MSSAGGILLSAIVSLKEVTMVRAKMQVVELNKSLHWSKCTIVVLRAVTDDRNKTWAKFTPSGEIKLTIDNPEAVDQFQLGEHYFVDFTRAPAAEADEKK